MGIIKAVSLILVILASQFESIAQVANYRLIQTDLSNYKLTDTLISQDKAETSFDAVNPILEALIAKDYLEASLDSVRLDETSGDQLLYLHVGPQYNFEALSLDSLSQDLLKRLDLRNPRTTEEFLLIREKLANYYANNGYPFTNIRLRELELEEGVVSGYLDIAESRLITLDSLIVHGNVQIRQGYLKNYLDLEKGAPYDHSKIKAVRRKLDQLNFLTVAEDPSLSFVYDYASLNLFLEKKNSSRFDLIFGVIPTNNLGGQQLFLSLDFTAEMLNKLGYGEYIFVNFERLRPEQQKFQINTSYPYFLDTKFGLEADFSIFRNSTTYQTVNSDLGVQYLINSNDLVKVSWNYEASKIIEIDTAAILNASGIRQDSLDLSVAQTGLALKSVFSRLDHRFNPRSGYSLTLGAVGGQKRILLDQNVLALNPERYDGLDLKSARYQLSFDFSYFLPLARRGAIGTHLKGAWRYSPSGLFRNELFQIGGNKLLRGFDEASIFTPYYALTTVEFRLLLAENSYLSAPFVDFGFVEQEGANTLAIGLGSGLVLETKVGMFNFAIAVGRSGDQGFDFGKPKAHFGYISLF